MSGPMSYTIDRLEDRLLLASVPSGFTDTTVATGLNSPTAMVVAPDGRIFVSQQGGDIRIIKNGALLSTPFATLPMVNSQVERGFLGIELDPNFNTNHFVYVYYTTDDGGDTHNRIGRLTADGDVAAPGSLTDLVDLPPLDGAIWHMGGAMHFGIDGELYVGVGDHQYFDGTKLQTLEVPFGKILRFNADGTIPTDNPFYNQATGINRATWAMGLRNPFTFGIEPGTGKIFINDVGQETWEEINLGAPGANYGWPNSEGPDNTNGFTAPIYYYNHNTGAFAITGGTFYDPSNVSFPQNYVGQYFFADLTAGWIKTLDSAHGNTVADFATGLSSPVDLDVAPDGSLYYLQRGADVNQGSIGKISSNSVASSAPQILTNPADQTVAAGQSVTFTVAASGNGLSYQWTRNNNPINGATASSFTIDDVTEANGGNYRVVVSNNVGDITSDPATLTVTPNTPPVAKIVSPVVHGTFRAGTTITLDGRGTDAEDGKLGPSKFTWQVDYHTGAVVRPFIAATTGSRTLDVTIPTTTPFKQTNVYYRIILTITDSKGATAVAMRDIGPLTGVVTITSNLPGVQLTVDEQPKGSPFAFAGVAGLTRILGAPETATVGGLNYVFDNWSDGGEAEHEISTAVGPSRYVARYRLATVTGQSVALAATSDSYVYGGDPSGNFGSSDTLLNKTWPDDQFQRDIYIKFDLTNVNSPIVNAKLRLFGQLNSAADQNMMIGVYAAPGAKWDQSTITWNNRPGFSGKALNSAVVNDDSGQWYNVDVTSYLQAEQAKGRKIITFVVRSVTQSSVVTMFNSREANDNQPELNLLV